MSRIVIINNGLAGGGTERASISFAHYLLEQGHEVIVLALYQSEHFYHLSDGIKLIEPHFNRNQNSTYGYILRMMKYVRQNIKLLKPDSILSYNEWTNAYVILACLGLGLPVYVSERMHPKARLPKATEFLRKLLYKRASGVIAQTTYGKSIIQQKTRAKNVVAIPNAVNIMEPIKVAKKKQLVSVGRLEKVKGHHILINAFAKVEADDWTLCIVGDGSERKALEELAIELHVSDRIKFKGHKLDFREELSESQIYVLPSLKEGYPNALIEAMSLPIACISGDFYEGDHDLVEDGKNGLLVLPGDSEALAEAINQLIGSEELRKSLAKEAFDVRAKLAFDVIAEEVKNFIL